MLLLIALLGQRFVSQLDWAANPKGWFKRGLGILFVLVGIAIVTGFDKVLEIAILDAGFFDVTQIENQLLEDL